MEKLEHYNLTKIILGENVIDNLCNEISPFGKKALIIIGHESVKKNGLYPRIISLMNIYGLEHYTFESIQLKPTYQDADHAIRLTKEKNIEFIIAVGDDKVFNIAKAISIGYYADHSVWDFYLQKANPHKALPLVCVSTLAKPKEEKNEVSILHDCETGIMRDHTSNFILPKISFFDSGFTIS